MDYVIGYFRDSTGRQFVLTPHGWAQRQGEQWGPPANPGYEAEDCVLQMAEAGDGTLFAQGEHKLLVLKNGRWEPCASDHTRLVCGTHDGRVAAVEYNAAQGRLWFSLWDGNKFVRASAPVPCQSNARFYHLREAPDGSLWCVGFGAVGALGVSGGDVDRLSAIAAARGDGRSGPHLVCRGIQRCGGRRRKIPNPASGKFQSLE